MPRRTTIMSIPRDAKVNDAQPKTAEQIFAEKDAKIAELEKELAELKAKMRWRDENVEPAPKETECLVLGTRWGKPYYNIASYHVENWYDRMGDILPVEITHWRPLDLPEDERKC